MLQRFRWKDGVLDYEADPKHREILMKAFGLGEDSNGVVSPVVKGDADKGADSRSLEASEAREFRAHAARANYLSQDRPDLQYAAKEVCREMAKPTVESWGALKRLVRYLVAVPSLTWKFHEGEAEDMTIDVFADSDWAGCLRTRRSTSGGVACLGGVGIKSWSSTQPVIAMSSAEAELYALVRAASEGLGIQAVAADLGCPAVVKVWVDSSAAKSACSRVGLGRLRHLEVKYLWVQAAVAKGRVALRRVPGHENPADVLTKPKTARDLGRLLSRVGARLRLRS